MFEEALQYYEKAITFFDTYISINNKNIGAYYNRAISKYYLGALESALLDIDSAIMIEGNNSLLYEMRDVLMSKLNSQTDTLQ
jgi:tetratricopeptide (TPR) repeat protein